MQRAKLAGIFTCVTGLLLMSACGAPSRTAVATMPGFPIFSFPNTPDRLSSTVISSNSMSSAAGINGRMLTLDAYERNSPSKTLLTIDIHGNVGISGTLNSASDLEKKYDITAFQKNGLDILRATNIVTYRYKGERSDIEKHVGFIPEDTPAIISGPQHNQMNINTSLSVTMDATKRLDQEIQKLQSQVAELKSEVNALREAHKPYFQ